MKNSKKILNASMTLESSFIYPVIIIISVLLIMYSFYIHDKSVVQSDLYRILIENSNYKSEAESPDSIGMQLEDECLLSYSFDVEYPEDSSTLQVTNISSSDFTSISTEVSFTGHERCDFIREYYTLLCQINKLSTEK